MRHTLANSLLRAVIVDYQGKSLLHIWFFYVLRSIKTLKFFFSLGEECC